VAIKKQDQFSVRFLTSEKNDTFWIFRILFMSRECVDCTRWMIHSWSERNEEGVQPRGRGPIWIIHRALRVSTRSGENSYIWAGSWPILQFLWYQTLRSPCITELNTGGPANGRTKSRLICNLPCGLSAISHREFYFYFGNENKNGEKSHFWFSIHFHWLLY